VKAIPMLFENTKDSGTVVRWSAAFALTEIAQTDSAQVKKLASEFERIIKTEENNGVKNVYLKALKKLRVV